MSKSKQEKGSARMISKLTGTTAFAILIASSFGLLPIADAQTNSAESAESIVRRAYHMAEGNVMDMEGFKNLFADDGVVRASGKTYQGDQIPSMLYFSHQLVPDVHREILRVHTIGNFVAVEMAFRGTFTGTFETPAGTIKGNGTKIDVRGADLWYVENGKIKEFNCYLEVSVMQEQLGLLPALVVKK